MKTIMKTTIMLKKIKKSKLVVMMTLLEIWILLNMKIFKFIKSQKKKELDLIWINNMRKNKKKL